MVMFMAEVELTGDARALAEILERHGITQVDLAVAMGKHQTTVSGYLDRARWTPRVLGEVADALCRILESRGSPARYSMDGIRAGGLPDTTPSIREALSPEGELPSSDWVKIRYVGTVPCGVPLSLGEPGEDVAYLSRDRLPAGLDPDRCVGLTAVGRSMERARIFEGDMLVVDTSRASFAEPGEVVIAEVNGGAVCRRLEREGHYWRLVAYPPVELSDAPEYRGIIVGSRDEIRVLGVVIYVQPAGFSPGRR
jgi:SOS-response transcriptional repressor LexA